MQAIQAIIMPGDTGPGVANLYTVLQFLIKVGVFASLASSDLAALKDQLRSEESSRTYTGAAVTLVRQFQIQSGLGGGLSGVVEDQTADLLNQQLKKTGAFDTDPDFVVRGTVKDVNGRPQGGLVVIAFDRDLRRWQELGRAATDPMGRFEIPYRYESFRQAEGVVQPEVDLVLQVARMTDNDGLQPIHVHEEPKPVPSAISIDVVLPAEFSPSEFARVTALIKPLLIGQGELIAAEIPLRVPPPLLVGSRRPFEIGGLRADGLIGGAPEYADLSPDQIDDGDVAFIVRETELDAEVVQAWVESARWQQAVRVLGSDAHPDFVVVIEAHGWSFFFNWIREGQLPELMGVLRSEAQTWLTVQRKGEALNRIPPLIERDWYLLVAALQELARLAAVDHTFNSGDPLAELLRQSPYPIPRWLKFEILTTYLRQGLVDPDAFLQLIEWYPSEAMALGAFVRTMRLNSLTGGSEPLVGALNSLLSEVGVGDSIEPLAHLGQQAWLQLIQYAANADPTSEHSALASLAAVLQWRLEQLHPLSALKARLDDSSVNLVDSELDKLRDILNEHSAGAEALLKGKNLNSPAVNSIESVVVKDALRNFGRFGQLGLSFERAGFLFAKGITTLAHVAQHDPHYIRSLLQNGWPQELVHAFLNNVTKALVEG